MFVKMSLAAFVQKARQVHGSKYDYSKVVYEKSKIKVEIVCPEHGSFFQRPNDHLQGHGCPTCSGVKRLITEEFIQKAQQVHGSKYDYSRVKYINNKTKVRIICPAHGSFFQIPYEHLKGRGCQKCKGEYIGEISRLGKDGFIQKARLVHGDKYDYSKVEYRNNMTKVGIICPEHGIFEQTPANHLQGHGCPRCFNRISRGEQELADSLKEKGLQVVQSYRKWHPERPKLEIDIFLPEHKVGIEYNGEYWHKEPDRDKEKVDVALQQGIRIITVWETEWKKDKDEVLERILGCLKN